MVKTTGGKVGGGLTVVTGGPFVVVVVVVPGGGGGGGGCVEPGIQLLCVLHLLPVIIGVKDLTSNISPIQS